MRPIDKFRHREIAMASVTAALSIAGLVFGGKAAYQNSEIDDIRQSDMGSLERNYAVAESKDAVSTAGTIGGSSEFASALSGLGLALSSRRRKR